jgi:hypothetical protein
MVMVNDLRKQNFPFVIGIPKGIIFLLRMIPTASHTIKILMKL